MILDASFIIDLMAGDDGAIAKLDEMTGQYIAVPTLVYTEVAVGLELETEHARQFEAVMDEVSLVPYDAEAARRAVDLQRQLRSQGELVGAVDAMIAGTALARDEPVVTRNVSEFARTPARISPY